MELTEIQTKEESLRFVKGVNAWERRFGLEIKTSTNRGRVFSDIIRARSMLLKALLNLFHYLDNSKIPCDLPPQSDPLFSSQKVYLDQGGKKIGKKKYSVENIVSTLREVEVLTGSGQPLKEVLRQIGISDATYYKWRKEYGGLKVDQAKRYKDLELENQRLRKVIADLTIDNSILKEFSKSK